MMSGEKELTASEKLADHITSINSYIELGNLKFSGFKEEFLLISDMSTDQLRSLTQYEMFDAAYLLYGYATYIQDEINKNKIALNWCNN